MAKVIITGVNGLLGKHVAKALLDVGHEVLGISIEPNPYARHARLSYECCDITDTAHVERIVSTSRADALIHLAALVHVRDAKLGFGDYDRVNFRASECLFKCAKAADVQRILFTSSVEVYGPTQHRHSIDESTPCRPDSDYARTKLLAEEALASVAADGTIAYAILRLAPVYSRTFRLNLDKRLYLRPPTLGYYVSNGQYQLALCSVRNIEHFVTRWLTLTHPQVGEFNLADELTYPIKDLLAYERQAGRCKLTLRLPYVPTLLALACLNAGLDALGHRTGMLTASNLRKLVRSPTWDTQRATHLVGRLPWNFQNTMSTAFIVDT